MLTDAFGKRTVSALDVESETVPSIESGPPTGPVSPTASASTTPCASTMRLRISSVSNSLPTT